MPDPYVGEIRMFAGTFAPRDWAFCEGQVLPISQYQVLYSILGANFGGNGTTTFALPDLRGRAPVQAGTGPGLSPFPLGAMAGYEHVTMTTNNLPPHTHNMQCSSGAGNQDAAQNAYPADEGHPDFKLYSNTADALMGPTTSAGAPSPTPIPTRSPALAINFIIALDGLYPPRS